jgi:hypothetical protein
MTDIMQRWRKHYCMYTLTLQAAPVPDPPDVAGLAWQFLESTAAARLFADNPALLRFIRRLLHRGYVGVVLTVDGAWASYVWMAVPGEARPPHVPARLEPQAYWLFSSATQPRFAGRGLYKFAMRLLLAEAWRRTPGALVLADVEPDNLAPRRGTASVGFAPAGMLDCSYCWIPRLAHFPLTGRWDRTAQHPPLDQASPGAAPPQRPSR